MSIEKHKRWGAFAYACTVALLANALLFNLIFSGGPLRIWKQVLALALYWVFFKLFRKTFPRASIPAYSRVRTCILLSFMIIAFLSLYSLIVGLSALRVLFAGFMYLGWLPFLVFPFISKNGEKSFFRLFSILGILLGAGLIVDHFFGIFHFLSLGQAGETWMESKDLSDIRRASFLFESPTALSYYLNFCLLSLVYVMFNTSRSSKQRLISALGAILLVAGASLTASRQVIATAIFLICFGSLSSFFTKNKGKSNLAVFFIITTVFVTGVLVITKVVGTSEQRENIYSRYVDIEEGIYQRSDLWREGLSLFSLNNAGRWLLGHGIGSCMGQHAKPTETVHHHYESSFFMTFHEGGLMLLFIVYWPSILSFTLLLKKNKCHLQSLLLLYIICFWAASFIAPGVLHPTAQMCIYLTLGLTLSLPSVRNTKRIFTTNR